MDKEKLFKENINLVRFTINKYFRNVPEQDYDDYYQEGMIGLWHAVTRYDETKGVAFSTFAVHLIRNQIAQYLRYERNHTIPSPNLVSLNYPVLGISDKNDITLQDCIEDTSNCFALTYYEALDKLIKIKDKVISKYNQMYQAVYNIHFYSIVTGKRKSQTEIAKEVGTNQVHVSRIVSKLEKEILEVYNTTI